MPAHQIQEQAKGLYFDKVLPLLDEMFNRLSPNGSVYRFNRLEIDLGRVDPGHFEEAFVEQLPGLLEKFILEQKADSKFSSSELKEDFTGTEKGSQFDAFVHFLKTGSMPWWFSVKGNELPEKLFGGLADNLSKTELKTLESMYNDVLVRARIAKQFSQHFINKLLFPELKHYKNKELAGKQGAGLVSILSEIIDEFIKLLIGLSVGDKIQQIIRYEMLKTLMNDTVALKVIEPGSIPEKFTPEILALVENSIQIMVIVLLKEGYDYKRILELLEDAPHILSKKSLTGMWLQKNSEGDKILKKVEAWSAKNNLDGNTTKNNQKNIELKEPNDDLEILPEEGIYIDNAGLIILWPFLKPYFKRFDLLDKEKFKTPEAKERAILLLEYAVSGRQTFPEFKLALNKILCGWPLHLPIYSHLEITEKEKSETNELINSAIEKWSAIGKVSIEGFRESFLHREGRLQISDSGWNLKVERKSIDLLLDRLPWVINMVRLPWMYKVLYVDW